MPGSATARHRIAAATPRAPRRSFGHVRAQGPAMREIFMRQRLGDFEDHDRRLSFRETANGGGRVTSRTLAPAQPTLSPSRTRRPFRVARDSIRTSCTIRTHVGRLAARRSRSSWPVGERSHEQRSIGHAAGEHADGIQRIGNHLYADASHRAEGGLVSHNAAKRRGTHSRAGCCEPKASGTIQSATAAAEPDDEPPGVCCRSRGLRVGPG